MAKPEELQKYYHDLNQEIIHKAAIEDQEGFRVNIFTEIYMGYLTEAAEVEDGNCSPYDARGVQVNGYSISEDETVLTLFVSMYKNAPDLFTVPPSEVVAMINRAKQFYLLSMKRQLKIDEAKDAFDLDRSINELRNQIEEVRILFLTNGTVRSTILASEEIEGVIFTPSVWDLERIYRVTTSGNAREKIEFDLEEISGKKLDAIKVVVPTEERALKDGSMDHTGGYTSYFTVFPGDVLYKIYERYKSRLLEKNVRAFLQAKGGVNKGIKATILETPEMFLAYNNGISATAESISTEEENGNACKITGLSDFQIVNGGQTTASIFNACIKDKKPLDKIFVQAKITVLDNQEQMGVVVPQISACANTQNKVQLADFSANDIFHQTIEKLSRSVWISPKTGGEKQTKWYYCRARGQYADDRANSKSPKDFDSVFPKEQYFDKVDLARYENVWDQLPHITSKGGQTGFRDFTIRLKKRGNFIPDEAYYKQLIAKAILYRRVYKLVRAQKFQGFWANIADYTVAYLSYKTAQRIDLDKIYKNQSIPEEVEIFAVSVMNAIYKYLIEECSGVNTTQWCKKEDCWNAIKKLNVALPENVTKGLIMTESKATGINTATNTENLLIDAIKSVTADTWFAASRWGKETSNLAGYQCGIAGTLGRNVGWHRTPSIKQAKQGLKILEIAIEKGFITEQAVIDIVKKHEEDL